MSFFLFFFYLLLQDIDEKPNLSGLYGACVLWNVLTTAFFPEWDGGVVREKRVGLKKIWSISPDLYFFGHIWNGLELRNYAFRQSRQKSLCKSTFFLRSRGYRSWELLPGADGSLSVLCPAEGHEGSVASARGLECHRQSQVLKARSGAVVLIHKAAWKLLFSGSYL